MDYGINTKITRENINDVAREYNTPSYKKLFKRLNIDVYEMLYTVSSTSIEHYYDIELTTEIFEKQGRKCFPKKATSTTTKTVTAIEYLNMLTGVLFFHDRISYGYTYLGYIPYTTTCVNPSGDIKIRRTYKLRNAIIY